MNSLEVTYCLQNDNDLRYINGGVFAANRLPEIKTLPFGFVANTDPDTKPGSHWVSFYFDANGNCDYFDSYGRKPITIPFKHYLRGRAVKWNDRQVQSYLSSACGHHSLFFLHERAAGVGFEEIVRMYARDLNDNDSCVSEFVADVLSSAPPLQPSLGEICQTCTLFCYP